MSETEKPFACPSPGCNMSFVNEDHLTVHRKKHDMVLNLGSNSKGTVFVADQTPTPTRFIRNCEEVGLFQDLQNVNPFEETFRRAVEAGKSGTLTVPEVGMPDDTLHTPHIFPHIVDVQSANGQDLLANGVTEPPVISIADSPGDKVTDSSNIRVCPDVIESTNDLKKIEMIELEDEDSQNPTIVETIVVREQSSSISTTTVSLSNETSQLSINGKEVQLLMKTEDGKLMQLSAIPVSQPQVYPASIRVQSSAQTVVIKTEPSMNYPDKNCTVKSASSKLSLAKMKLKQVLKKNGVAIDNQQDVKLTTISNEDSGNDSRGASNTNKKQDILERNRASSMRARAKRKAWIQQLERSVYNVNETNTVLQLEVRALRSEVAKLKTLLLAHKDCPVTKAMEQGNSVILGPKVISFTADAIEATPLSTPGTAIRRASIISTDVGALPKKKPSISATMNPMILPKSCIESSPPPMHSGKIIRDVSSVKVVGIKHISTKRHREKPILIGNNRKRKCVENPRQIIRTNPNFELENAASKTTGS